MEYHNLRNSYYPLLSPAKYPLMPAGYPVLEPSPRTSIPHLNHFAHNPMP
ncbi:unknown [Bacteroides sp. CAG:1076]|nr:unknown [Bacteroides sp. CAG:1076]